MSNVALLREDHIDGYLASAETYRLLRAEVETPDKAALAYPDYVRDAVRRCVLEWKEFRPKGIMAMAAQAGIPDADREAVVPYVGNELRGLHEGQRDPLPAVAGRPSRDEAGLRGERHGR